MPAKLSPILYGEKKNIDYNKFNTGNILKAITYDLKEFGEKGVQGVPVKASECPRMAKQYMSGEMAKREPYAMAGVFKNDLVFVIRHKKDPKFEVLSILVKNYVGLKEKLAKSSAKVVNLQKGDKTIDGAAKAQADKFKTTVDEKDSSYGTVTGNILLCAHGTPKTKPGRVMGTKLAGLKPSQICDILTKNKDKKKNLAKDYSGKITLSGCFTASGGPEKDKQDDPFAKKVKDELSKRGYKSVSVVGMPGPSWTARSGDGSDRDAHGKMMKRGDKGGWAKSEERLEAQEKQAVKLRKDIDKEK